MDLFSYAHEMNDAQQMKPLAARLRPRTLDEVIGQEHILGPGKLLRRAIEADQLSSLIFYGPPGTGKTTLAKVIAGKTRSHFAELNAVTAGVSDIRRIVDEARERLLLNRQRTTLFIDEIHRFNKAQQDALLPYVEDGTIILIGATTENPFFEVNPALLSRSRIFPLHPLTEEQLRQVLQRALTDQELGLGELQVTIDPEAEEHLIRYADGDARRLLNALELAATTTPPGPDGRIVITLDVAVESIQRRAVRYDKSGDNHYDTISAFIKSIRGSDPDAALYWLARMLDAGEDPRFIARRLVIAASEDIGNADPQAGDGGRFLLPGAGAGGHAGRAHPAGSGDDLSGFGSQKQRGVLRHQRSVGGDSARWTQTGAAPSARPRVQRSRQAGARRRLPVPA